MNNYTHKILQELTKIIYIKIWKLQEDVNNKKNKHIKCNYNKIIIITYLRLNFFSQKQIYLIIKTEILCKNLNSKNNIFPL